MFSGWPDQFEGKTLTPLPLTELEQRFTTDFPGKIGRFTDGKREIIIRWVTEATRKLHPASDCFQGIGYSVKPLALHRDNDGSLWASFAATKGDERLRVYERIHSEVGRELDRCIGVVLVGVAERRQRILVGNHNCRERTLIRLQYGHEQNHEES